jgi:hypothetical protein
LYQDGWKSLHNLELTVYGAFLESEEFRRVVLPGRAEHFASRLLATLAPLFSIPDSQGQAISSQSWGDSWSIHDNRKSRLIDIFQIALKLKAATVTIDLDCEFVVYPPGCPHLRDNLNHGERTWQHASFSTYNMNMAASGQMSDALVRTANFKAGKALRQTRNPSYQRYITSSSASMVERLVVERPAPTTIPVLSPRAPNPDEDEHGINDDTRNNRIVSAHEFRSSEVIANTEDGSSNGSPMESRPDLSTGTKIWQCETCTATFATSVSLERHKKNSTSLPLFHFMNLSSQLTLT